MKLNKNKIIVSAFALLIGTSLAGSVTGTLAWYQYSTRSNVSFLGEASGISGNLQVRFQGQDNTKWKTKLTYGELETYLANTDYAKDVQPITFGSLTKDSALPEKAYIQPAAGVQAMANWKVAEKKHYVRIPLQLRFVERDGELNNNNVDDKNVQKDVYLTKLLIQQDASNATNANGAKSDLSDAVRVHVHAYKSTDEAHTKVDKLISKTGGSTATSGKLDLDGDGSIDVKYANDSDEFGFTTGQTTPIMYGDDGVQVAYAAKDVAGTHTYIDGNDTSTVEDTVPALVTGSDANGYNTLKLTNLTYPESTDSKKIGQVEAGEIDTEDYLNVDITIWIEGWQRLSNGAATPEYLPIWDAAKYAGSKFNIGIQFAVQED